MISPTGTPTCHPVHYSSSSSSAPPFHYSQPPSHHNRAFNCSSTSTPTPSKQSSASVYVHRPFWPIHPSVVMSSSVQLVLHCCSANWCSPPMGKCWRTLQVCCRCAIQSMCTCWIIRRDVDIHLRMPIFMCSWSICWRMWRRVVEWEISRWDKAVLCFMIQVLCLRNNLGV